jgi:hypothetical protein
MAAGVPVSASAYAAQMRSIASTANGGRLGLPSRAYGGNQHHQIGPRHDPVHVVQEFALAGAIHRQVQSKVSLFHALSPRWLDDSLQAQPEAIMQNFPDRLLATHPRSHCG